MTLFTYLMIALFFGGFMIISLFLGGGDHDVDHEAILGHDGVNGDSCHDTIHDHDGSLKLSGMLQGWLSIKVISAFGTAFGSAGAIAVANGFGGIAIWCAIGSGLVIAILCRGLMMALYKSECTTSNNRSSIVGTTGTLTIGIVDSNLGEAQFNINNELVAVPVRSCDGKSIRTGSLVIAENAGIIAAIVRKV